jgi:hypothetical protein
MPGCSTKGAYAIDSALPRKRSPGETGATSQGLRQARQFVLCATYEVCRLTWVIVAAKPPQGLNICRASSL